VDGVIEGGWGVDKKGMGRPCEWGGEAEKVEVNVLLG
jgi:hypothetical protein